MCFSQKMPTPPKRSPLTFDTWAVLVVSPRKTFPFEILDGTA
ncbi:hypothetical protein HMPREF0239_01199 [Clostridium sp. ATCC BAA-442]|nr:hypothetical protein HMPREF0239_01199 [Clostridium sp. ATCC BAA-442]